VGELLPSEVTFAELRLQLKSNPDGLVMTNDTAMADPQKMGDDHDIFISYFRRDQTFVRNLYAALGFSQDCFEGLQPLKTP
jgi:hypothetical protein